MKNLIFILFFQFLFSQTIPVEIVSSHYVDPKGERVRS